jgi:DnaJ-class molecular chaperone
MGPLMKPSLKQTHYKTLDIPMNASPVEIKQAYLEAFELYRDDSMAACAFFSNAERKDLLARLEEAYLTLINPEAKSDYDRSLMTMGIMEEKQSRDASQGLIPLYDLQRKQTRHMWLTQAPDAVTSVVSENSLIREILKQDRLTGQDLKRIRTTLEMPLVRVFLQTRIPIATLEAIEDDRFDLLPPTVYIKGFLKMYAQCLQIDTDTVVQAYMKHLKGDN